MKFFMKSESFAFALDVSDNPHLFFIEFLNVKNRSYQVTFVSSSAQSIIKRN